MPKPKREGAAYKRAGAKLEQEIIHALEVSELPKTRDSARRIAYWMKHALQIGCDMPAIVAAGFVELEMAFRRLHNA